MKDPSTPRTFKPSRLGMFDLCIGFCLILVIFGHTRELFPAPEGVWEQANLVMSSVVQFIIPMFFVASGFGFRKMRIRKCVKQQAKMVLLPYAYAAIAAIVFHIIVRTCVFGYLPGELQDVTHVIGGLILGVMPTTTYGGFLCYSCGPLYFILALAVAWIILNICMNLIAEKWMPVAMVVCATAAWLLGMFTHLPFCITQGLATTCFLYTGYIAKKKKFFGTRPPVWFWLCAAACFLVCLASTAITGVANNIPETTWSLGPISIVCECFTGLAIAWLFVRLGEFRNPAFTAIERFGRASIYIFCIHAVEYIAVPWYAVAPLFANTAMGTIAIICMRFAVIAAMYFVLMGAKKLVKQAKHKKELEQSERTKTAQTQAISDQSALEQPALENTDDKSQSQN